MADDGPHDLTKVRKVLVEMRRNWIKTIADGYMRGELECIAAGDHRVAAREDKAELAFAANHGQRADRAPPAPKL